MSDGLTNLTKVYIGPVSANETTASAFAALSWVEVKGVDSVPNLGGKDSVVSYTTLDDNVVNKKKGATDYGSGDLIVIERSGDAGQTALKAAFASRYPYSIKIVVPTANSGAGTDGIRYYHALVSSSQPQNGAAGQALKRTFTLDVVDAPVEVDAT